MRRAIETVAGLVLFAALAWAGEALAVRLALPVPGAVIGLGAYLLLLASGHGDWSLRTATLLTGLIGAMIVPALVGLAAFAGVLTPALGKLALVLAVSTAITGLATATLFRFAGGRA